MCGDAATALVGLLLRPLLHWVGSPFVNESGWAVRPQRTTSGRVPGCEQVSDACLLFFSFFLCAFGFAGPILRISRVPVLW